MNTKRIILVDEEDKEVGTGEKIAVHRTGKLHRAFSIFLFNSKGETLIQQRAKTKYHSANLWSNTCCSHPAPGEILKKAAKRRLKEEMGIECGLREILSFIYKVNLGKLIEHEFNHVFIGNFNGLPKPNKREVQNWKWISLGELRRDVKKNPQKYTYWFKMIFNKVFRVAMGKNISAPEPFPSKEKRITSWNKKPNIAKKVVVGGTFDVFHKGHKALLRKAFSLGNVTIGVTSDEMARKLKKRRIKSFKQRKKELEKFIAKEFSVKAKIVRIEDKFGPTLKEDFDYIVVSPATYKTAQMINKERRERVEKPMKIVKIKFIVAEDGRPISATRILKREIDNKGKILR